MSDLMDGISAVVNNATAYQIAHEYYEGEVGEVFSSMRMRQLLTKSGKLYNVNLAKTAVDAVADRLSISSVVVPKNDTAQIELDKIWKANLLRQRSSDINRRGCEYGDAYVFVQPATTEGEPPSIMFNNPRTTRVIYDCENQVKPLYAIKFWKEGDYYRASLFYADRIERYITAKEGDPKNENDWQKYADEFDDQDIGVWPIFHDWKRIPIFHIRNGDPYGRPEHYAGYGPQNAVNKLAATQMATTDYHGFPQRYALEEAGLEGRMGNDGIGWGTNDGAETTTTTQDRSKLRSGPGEMWFLQGVKDAGQFDAADPSKFMDPLEVYVRLLAQVTGTPLHYFDPSGDAPSGESLRTAEGPLNKKVIDRQERFSVTWEEILIFALSLMGIEVDAIDIQWSPAETIDDLTGWQTIALKTAAGVPDRQALLEAGYARTQLDAWGITDDTSTLALKRHLETLQALANAVQGLSAGVSFGLFSEDDVRALVNRMVGAGAP